SVYSTPSLHDALPISFVKRATFTVTSPAPLKTGLPIVPLTSTSNPRLPSSCSSAGTNCRTKFTELRGRRAFAVMGVSSGNFRARSEEHTSELQSPDHL